MIIGLVFEKPAPLVCIVGVVPIAKEVGRTVARDRVSLRHDSRLRAVDNCMDMRPLFAIKKVVSQDLKAVWT